MMTMETPPVQPVSPYESGSQSHQDVESEAESEALDPTKTCCICIYPIEIFAVAQCEHVLCYKCLIRITYRMQKDECPSCREVLAGVVYLSKAYRPYSDFSRRMANYDRRYKVHILKEDQIDIQRAISKLTAHFCLDESCYRENSDRRFLSIQQWTSHQKKEHGKHPCDLCVKNEYTFTHEVTLYPPDELREHFKEDHCRCKFCRASHYDKNSLFKHLRHDHEYCRLCENLTYGANLEYYDGIQQLKVHLEKDHHLCHHEDCNIEGSKEYSVYLTENELMAHIQMEHQKGRMGGKSRVRVHLSGAVSGSEFDRQGEESRRDGDRGGRGGRGRGSRYFYNDRHLGRGVDLIEEEEQGPTQQLNEAMESFGVSDFPTLGGEETGGTTLKADDGRERAPPPAAPPGFRPLETQLKSEESFPTLGGKPVQSSRLSQPTTKPTKKQQKSKSPPLAQSQKEAFPALGAGSKKRSSKKSNSSKKPATQHTQKPTAKIEPLTDDHIKAYESPKSSDQFQEPEPLEQLQNNKKNLKQDNFPGLPGAPSKSHQPKGAISIAKENFPGLPVTQKPQKKKGKQKQQSHAPIYHTEYEAKWASAGKPKTVEQNGPTTSVKVKPDLSSSAFPTLAGPSKKPAGKPAPGSMAAKMMANPKSTRLSKAVPQHIRVREQVRRAAKLSPKSKPATPSPKVALPRPVSAPKPKPISKKPKEEEDDQDWWLDPADDPFKFARNYNPSAGRQSGTGLINGAHPLAAKVPVQEAVQEVTRTERFREDRGDFPGLQAVKRAPGQSKSKQKTSTTTAPKQKFQLNKSAGQWVSTAPPREPEPIKEELPVQPDMESAASFPGLAAGGSGLSRNFHTKDHPKFQKEPESPWAGLNVNVKKSGNKKK